MIKRVFKILGFLILVLIIVFFAFSFYLSKFYTVPILMYHSLDKNRVGNYSAVDPERFREQLKFIHDNNYKILSLDEYARLLNSKQAMPRKSVVITFDDGEKDNLALWLVIKEYNVPITIFMIVDNIDKEGFLSLSDIKGFLNNSKVSFGSHTLTHPYLPDVSLKQLKEEILGSKKKLEKLLGKEITAICYPIGGFDERVLMEVKAAGYIIGVSTNRGFSNNLDPLALRRIKITNKDTGLSLWAKLSGFYNFFKKPKRPY